MENLNHCEWITTSLAYEQGESYETGSNGYSTDCGQIIRKSAIPYPYVSFRFCPFCSLKINKPLGSGVVECGDLTYKLS